MTRRNKFIPRPAVVAVIAVACLIVYWAQLLASYDHMRGHVRVDTLRLASQSAHALSLQVNTLFQELDYFSQQLSTAWLEDTPKSFDRSVVLAMEALTPGALVQVAVADAQGVIVYSRLASGPVVIDASPAVSIADREHFKVHQRAAEPQLYISEPVMGRVSNQWTIQFTRGLWEDGVFKGVLVVAVSAKHLSAALEAVFPDLDDVAVILNEDGAYLARSRDLTSVLGMRVPVSRQFLQDKSLGTGVYDAVAGVDGVERYYSWWRGADYPFVLSVGYGKGSAHATVDEAINDSITQNIVGTVLLLLAGVLLLYQWTVRARQTEDLLQTQQRLALALKGGQLGSWDWIAQDGRLRVDQAWADIFGFQSPADVKNTTDWELCLHPQDRQRVLEHFSEALKQPDGIYDLEYRIVRGDGSIRWVSDRGQVVERDDQGEPVRMAGTKQDITQRVEAQQAEQAVRLQLSKLVAEVPGAVYQFKRAPDGRYSFPFASPGIVDIYGVEPEDVVTSAERVFQTVHPADLARVTQEIEQSARTLEIWHSEYRVLRSDGAIRWISGHSKPEKLDDGSVLWHGYLQDTTADHALAQALKASEAHLRLTLEAIQDGLWSYDHQAEIASWDNQIRVILGYTGENWQNPSLASLYGLIHPQDLKRLKTESLSLSNHRPHQVFWMEFRMKTAQGAWLWVQARGSVSEWNDDGSPKKTIGVLSDISRRVTEGQIRQALLDRSPAAIVLLDQKRQVLDANERARALFVRPGVPLNEISLLDVHLDKEHYARFETFYQKVRCEDAVRADFPLQDIQGQVHWFDMHGVLLDPSDSDSPVVWTLIDISARHAADAALRTERIRVRALLERFPGGVLIQDSDEKIVFVNDMWCELMGIAFSPATLVGLSHEGLQDLIGERRAQSHQQSLEMSRQEGNGRTLEIEDEGGQFLEMEHLEIAQDQERLGSVWFVWNITDRKRHEIQLRRLASTDPLTSLANRRSFLRVFEDHVRKVSHSAETAAGVILMLDIDHFKKVNDTYGHAAGDVVLKTLSSTIRQQIRDHDFAGRLGGEEFAVLLTGLDLKQGVEVAERIRSAVKGSYAKVEDKTIKITISIGLSPIDSDKPALLLERADKALYEAKQTGRDRVCVWHQ